MKKPKYSLLAMYGIAVAAVVFPILIGVGLIIYLLEDALHHDDVSIVIVVFILAMMPFVKKVIDYFGDQTKE